MPIELTQDQAISALAQIQATSNKIEKLRRMQRLGMRLTAEQEELLWEYEKPGPRLFEEE